MTDNGNGQIGRQGGALQRYGAVAIFLLAAVIIIAAAWGAFSHYAGDAREIAENDLLAVSDLKRAAIEAHIAELERNRDTFYDGHIVDTVKAMVAKGYKLPT